MENSCGGCYVVIGKCYDAMFGEAWCFVFPS